MAFTGKFFNTNYYLTQNADVAAKWTGTALSHYVTNGAAEGRSPNATFDYQYYRANNADLATMTALQAFEHYENFGYKEGRVTAAAYANFDEANYLATYADLGKAGITEATALNHYLTYGISENRTAKNDDGTVVSSSTSAVTYTLTTGVDNIVGAATNDTIDGSRIINGGVAFDGLGNADAIDGGAGSDTLFVQNVTAAASITPASIKNVETLSVESIAAVYTLNLTNADSSIKTLKIANSTAGAVNVLSNPTALTTLNIDNVNQAITVTSLAAGIAGTTDALAVNLMSATGAAGVSVAGYETINMTSNGTVANSIGILTDSSLATLNIMGAQDLTLTGGATSTSLTNINASTATGKVNVTLNAAQTQALKFTGGTANDTINFGGTYTSADTVDGGTGTDTLTLTNAEAIAATTTQSNVTNIETLTLSAGLNGTVSVNNFGATGLNFGGALGGAGIINFAAGTNSLNVSTFAGNTVTVNVAGVGTTDVLNYTIGSAATSTGNAGSADAVVINGAETVNISSVGGANTFGAALTLTNTSSTETLNISGNQNLTITGAVTAEVINASGMTGTAALLMTATTVTVAAGGATITGTGNNDVLVGSAVDDIFVGGAGADTIVGGVGADILTGGAGADVFVQRGTVAAVWTDSLAVAGSVDRITDFVAGTDKISIVNTGVATTSVVMTSVTVGTAANVAAILAGVGNSVAATVGGAQQVGLITVSAGAMAGTYLLLNDLVNAAAATDTLINITGVSGTVTASDFVLG
jgi:hypothetical protein